VPAPLSGQRNRIFSRVAGAGISARAADGVTVIDVLGEIGSDVKELDFATKLDSAADILLRVNSPGGSCFAGLGIFNRLVRHDGHIRAEVTGIAASAASVICMAADEIAVPKSAHLMVHRAWSMTIGNGADHLYMAEFLAKMDAAMAGIYAQRSGMSEAQALAIMDQETWLDGEEALDAGLATEVPDGEPSQALFDLSAYANVPQPLRQFERPQLTPRSQVELARMLRDGTPWRKGAAEKIAALSFTGLTKRDHPQPSPFCEAMAAAAAQLRQLKGTVS